MNKRLARAARRVRLQAQCALQRESLHDVHMAFAAQADRADRAIAGARGLGALVAAGAAVFLFAGPAGGLRTLRRGFALALMARQALRFLR